MSREVGFGSTPTSAPHSLDGVQIIVESIGLGVGVCDGLKGFEYNVTGYNSSEPSGDSRKYLNRREESYFTPAKLLEDGTVSLPQDAELWEELLAVEWKVAGNGSVQIEAKEKLKARLNRSPDKMDALVMAFGVRPRILRSKRFKVA
jgi:hypothetical protein